MNVAVPKPAATIMLLRDYQGELQVFMQQRAYESPFVGGAYVFPGGKVDDSDTQMDKNLLVLPDAKKQKALFQQEGAFEASIAVIRECFEESGFLLAYQDEQIVSMQEAPEQNFWKSQRDLLNADDITFPELCQHNQLRLALDQLVFFGHWVTPKSSPQRFDTLFFAALAPVFQEGDHDNFETIASVWWSPEQALEKYHKGDIQLITPTCKSLEHLARFDNAQAFIEHHALGLSVLGRDD